jgi:hypothetical protein
MNHSKKVKKIVQVEPENRKRKDKDREKRHSSNLWRPGGGISMISIMQLTFVSPFYH